MVFGVILSEQEIKAIADILGATECHISKSNLKTLLQQEKLIIVDDGYRSNGLTYRIGFNKRDWLYNCFVETFNHDQNCDKMLRFIEAALKE